jgi:hypothetical protein
MSNSLQPSPPELAAEGIRAARLSGFLICMHVRVHAESELVETTEFIRFARSLDVDGIVITPANRGANSTTSDAAALQRKTAEARKLIGSTWWKSFSRIVEPVVCGERLATQSAGHTSARIEQETHQNEEGVKVA